MKKIGTLYGFDILVKSETSKKEGFDMVQNRFYVRGEGEYLHHYNHGNLASDPRLAAQNPINALGTIESTLEKFRGDNEKMAKDIPVLKEVIEGTWRKEPELTALKCELTELDRKIQLSLKPIEDSEGEPINEPETGKAQAPQQDIRQPSQGNGGPQPYIPSRLREIADASGGRIVVAGVGSPPRKQDEPPNKGFKI